ncbi:DUF4292 domain-containing protein [Sphingobacterium detergens]|uniref:Uncharacterized protein DUF4292 n=1 Tax=Sphingobacterium detergens TaxID=1145106 RepID=A0A420ACH0_SPHD1|nr:DUF4292 domain-containing protein [Sphingobacterium detergens]RKE42106.1 uncharacterized protein DUF4292 [Sphingobacterium detergens]
MWNKIVWVGILVTLLSSCSSKKKLLKEADLKSENELVIKDNTREAKKATLRNLFLTNLSYSTFSGKAKMRLDLGKDKFDVTSNIRIEKDKRIWISISATLGIEVARVLITPDSVQILNKFQNEYMVKPFDYLYRFASPDLTFSNLQDLLLANISVNLLSDIDAVNFKQDPNSVQLDGKLNELDFLYKLNNNNRPYQFRLSQLSKKQLLEANYGEYAMASGQEFPMLLKMIISDGRQEIKTEINFNKVTFNEPVEMPFSVSSRYKVIR